MAAVDAVEFLISDHGDVENGAPKDGFRKEFAEDLPYRSLLQRSGKSLPDVLKIFDWTEDDAKWCAEYSKKDNDIQKLIRYKRRICFEVGGWRELNEDFGRGDVSCLRDIRTPLVTSRTPLKVMKDEFNER
jgi:hypothetical protein